MSGQVAPTTTELEEGLRNLAAVLGVTAQQAQQAMSALGQVMDLSPRAELRFRLNERLQGRDPGKPVNWRGLAA